MSTVAVILVPIWLVMVVIAVIGLVRGHLDWAHLRNRKHASLLLAASFIVFILIGAVAPEQSTDDVGTPNVSSSVTPPRTLGPSQTTSAPVVTPTTARSTTPAPAVTEPSASAPPVPSVTPTPTRAPDPLPFVPPPTTPQPLPPPPAPTTASAYYADCAAARAAGAAPLHRGEPGYRSGLDRDKDGVACE
ncbi:excalibur calcium-binding domain-containing protein [Nocardia aurea]|uniref:excalibur calcium-binding domain-containing protein n=1 Tax=Nocardia aurea TaxID=2144174 RepID=UPI0033A98583